MHEGVKFNTFYRFGIKYRTMVRTRAVGKSKILQLGKQPYSVVEKKEYADAMGSSKDDLSLPAIAYQAAEGGINISIANGVKTVTTIKG